MDIVRYWNWPAWVIAAVMAMFVVRLLWKQLRWIYFRAFQLDALVRKHGWQQQSSDLGDARVQFRQQEKIRRKKAWALLRTGWRGVREGYQHGVFGRVSASSWRNRLTITGSYRGYLFSAREDHRYEIRSSGDGTYRRSRYRSSLEISVKDAPVLTVSIGRFGQQVKVVGPTPLPEWFVEWLKKDRFRGRGFRAAATTISTELNSRMYHAWLLRQLDYLVEVAERLSQLK